MIQQFFGNLTNYMTGQPKVQQGPMSDLMRIEYAGDYNRAITNYGGISESFASDFISVQRGK